VLDVKFTLKDQVREDQKNYKGLENIRAKIKSGEVPDYNEDEKGNISFQDHLLVPYQKELKDSIMKETDESAYSIHPGSTNMYHDLRDSFRWQSGKHVITEYVTRCDDCRRVKTEHQKPARILQPVKLLECKWGEIRMYFIIGLPRTSLGYDSIWFTVDLSAQSANFIFIEDYF
jgi:hypothetical protein